MSNGIYQAIATAMSEIEPIAKKRRNLEQKFNFRGIDDVMNELSPILVKNKIFIYPEVTDVLRNERTTAKGGTLFYSVLTVKYHFTHEDGSELCCVVVGEGMDTGDKASNKAMAIAFKYACLQMFCIPTEDMPDPDAETPPPSTPQNNANLPQKPNGNGQKVENLAENERKTKAGEAIGKILETVDPDEQPFFNKKEIEIERKIFMTSNMAEIEKQYTRLKSELEKRKANWKPIPFGDSDNFENDIPEGMYPKQGE